MYRSGGLVLIPICIKYSPERIDVHVLFNLLADNTTVSSLKALMTSLVGCSWCHNLLHWKRVLFLIKGYSLNWTVSLMSELWHLFPSFHLESFVETLSWGSKSVMLRAAYFVLCSLLIIFRVLSVGRPLMKIKIYL